MSKKFPVYKGLNLSKINAEVLQQWEDEKTFEQSIEQKDGYKSYVFYEGPPSANGTPGIHHVMARAIKDVICRYKTQTGHIVHRKAGWDTHGLPVELGVEKKLGITKEDIGKTISIEDYNHQCRTDVMAYTSQWQDLTSKMGYWVDMEHPYITYDNKYIETIWYLLKELFDKGLLYKGYTIQPYSPAAGTGLSNHELNQPGCYKDVKDTTCTAQFKIIRDAKSEFLFDGVTTDLYFLAWTTTPWTLPSNTALAVGPNIKYVKVQSFNPYTLSPITVIVAESLYGQYFPKKNEEYSIEQFDGDAKKIPFKVLSTYTGKDLEAIGYEQLLPWVNPDGDAFRVILGDFVTTEDGTGIVHIAPTFGADDDRVAKQSGIAPLTMIDNNGKIMPMVDKTGKFFNIDDLDSEFVKKFVNEKNYKQFAGRFVKNAYDSSLTDEDTSLDVDICVELKSSNKAFKIEKHVHNYPHCWRTDKPVLYYPLDSWFIKTTAVKDRMIELNNTINWKPQSTGTGRFGKWLENLVDWNLSRSRYWGTPLPIWATEDYSELKCIGSVAELKTEIDKSVKAGFMSENPLSQFVDGDFTDKNYNILDLHRPYVDNIVLVSSKGVRMCREMDLIDVWFDSGAMPYAQVHYPFEMQKDKFTNVFPADFIAEGVDQTRGWFFTLHALGTMLFDSVAFKNIISNGLVLDKNGNKMSKRLGNGVDPFEVIDNYGADAVRWYMLSNSQPWDNLKFDIEGIDEVRRKFFGTLYNTYSFFALYANVDKFTSKEQEIPVSERPEIDRWIISLLNTLIKNVKESLDNYDPTPAARAIQDFVNENLSNWYVRLNRKRFWGGEMTQDKLAAYQTLHTCLKVVAELSAPFAPFISDRIYRDVTSSDKSVHVTQMVEYDSKYIDLELEQRMEIAQKISSMVLALRRKVNIKVRQPLSKIMIPILDNSTKPIVEAVKELILTEVNVKDIEFIEDTTGIMVKKIKANFKTLGPKYGKQMKDVGSAIMSMSQSEITSIERDGKFMLKLDSQTIEIADEDVEITSEDIPGWLVTSEGKLTVALDINLTKELIQEGIARELINRIQNIRKDSAFEVTDKVNIKIKKDDEIVDAINSFRDYIATQTLALSINLVDTLENGAAMDINEKEILILVEKVNA